MCNCRKSNRKILLQSRFLICKHLVQTINGRHKRLLYNEFQRNCTYPFWEFNSNSNIINTENANTDVSINDNVINNDNDIENILPEELWPQIQKLIHFTEHLKEEYEAHNYRHVKVLLDGSKRVRNMTPCTKQTS